MTIKQLVKKCHKMAVRKGFWDKTCWWCSNIVKGDVTKCNCTNEDMFIPRNRAELLMLIVSELGEACEALRNADHENFKEEIADTVIRILDCAEASRIDLYEEIKKKTKRNKKRPYKHRKAF